MLRDLIGRDDCAVRVRELMTEVTNSSSIREMLDASYHGPPVLPRLHGLGDLSKTADGARLVPWNLRSIDLAARERWTQNLEIREDGGIRYYDSCVGEPGPEMDGFQIRGLYLTLVVTTFREILALALELSRRHGFAGTWHLGVGITGIKGARATMPAPNPYSIGPVNPDPYTRDSYTLIASAPVREIEAIPDRVAERILGRLFRSVAPGSPNAFK